VLTADRGGCGLGKYCGNQQDRYLFRGMGKGRMAHRSVIIRPQGLGMRFFYLEGCKKARQRKRWVCGRARLQPESFGDLKKSARVQPQVHGLPI